MSSTSIFASMIFIPVVLEDMGASRLLIGAVVTSYSIALFFSSLFLGRYADVKGRRELLRIGFVIATITTFVQALATDILQLMIVRVLLGLSAGIVSSVLVGYFIYETKGRLGKFSSFGALGWGFGSIMAGIFGDPMSIFVFAGGLMAMAGVAIWTLPKTPEVTHRLPLFPKEVFKENASVYVSILIRHTGAHIVWVTYPLFLIEELGATRFWVGIIYAANALTQFIVMRRLDRINPSVLVAIGLGLSSLTFVLFTLTRSYLEIIPLQVVLAISFSSMYVGGLRYVTERSSEKATSTGWFTGIISVAAIIGPISGGYLNDLIDYRMSMIIASVLCLISLGVFYLYKNNDSRIMSSSYSNV